MVPLTKEEHVSFHNPQICHMFKEKLEDNILMIKSIVKLEMIAIMQVNTKVLHTPYVI